MLVSEFFKKRQELQGAVHAASDAVHRITGRTDQTLLQLSELYPTHPAVLALAKAQQVLKDHK